MPQDETIIKQGCDLSSQAFNIQRVEVDPLKRHLDAAHVTLLKATTLGEKNDYDLLFKVHSRASFGTLPPGV